MNLNRWIAPRWTVFSFHWHTVPVQSSSFVVRILYLCDLSTFQISAFQWTKKISSKSWLLIKKFCVYVFYSPLPSSYLSITIPLCLCGPHDKIERSKFSCGLAYIELLLSLLCYQHCESAKEVYEDAEPQLIVPQKRKKNHEMPPVQLRPGINICLNTSDPCLPIITSRSSKCLQHHQQRWCKVLFTGVNLLL